MKLDVGDFLQMKNTKPISMLTAYTTPIARCLEKSGIPIILVGDTVGMVEMGFDSTREVTIEHMEYHVGAVRRGAENTHIIGDLPYNTYIDPNIALLNAKRLIAAGADSVKLEGPKLEVIAHLVKNKIPVVGHTGLTPQTAKNFKKVGNSLGEAQRIKEEAIAIQKSGAFMLVLEHIPYNLAYEITALLPIPIIGIGAGPDCDGQVLVINDAIGLGDYWPPFSKQYAHVTQTINEVVKLFRKEVMSKEYPNNIINITASSKS